MAKKPDVQGICEDILTRSRKIAPDVIAIEAGKKVLREISKDSGEGFTEDHGANGVVEVKAGRKGGEFKAIVPTLKAKAFLALSEARREKLIEDGVVEMVTEYTKEASPSVTVRL